ncbi:ATP10 protein-domain-containing protein [Chlamydoabsidia padenii]|nr:ATP10 protein-domain-containing protein [Chlamydoabsidia padenii]
MILQSTKHLITKPHWIRSTTPSISLLRLYSTSPPEAPPPLLGQFREAPSILGARDPPVVDKNSWLQRKKQKLRDFTDYEKAFAAHAAERRHLVEEATKSYFADVHEMRKHGGKMYYASNKLTQPEKAGYMPDFEGSNVNREKVHTTDKLLGKISLMSFVYAKYGEPHVNSFVDPFLAKYKHTDGIQCIELNVQENVLKQLVLKAFIPSIRKNLPDNRKDNYMFLFKDITKTRKMLDMTNQYIGYVFLVDEDCKIRWTAHGDATQEEVANMLAMTDYLNQKRIKGLGVK